MNAVTLFRPEAVCELDSPLQLKSPVEKSWALLWEHLGGQRKRVAASMLSRSRTALAPHISPAHLLPLHDHQRPAVHERVTHVVGVSAFPVSKQKVWGAGNSLVTGSITNMSGTGSVWGHVTSQVRFVSNTHGRSCKPGRLASQPPPAILKATKLLLSESCRLLSNRLSCHTRAAGAAGHGSPQSHPRLRSSGWLGRPDAPRHSS